MKSLFVWCLIILFTFDVTSANKHTYGVLSLGGDTIFQKTLLDQENEVPKNYTIIFKYVMGKVSHLTTYFEIDVNVFSEGSVQVTDDDIKSITSTVSIPNARNVKATVMLRGIGKDLIPIIRREFNFDTSSKSYTLVYVKNATATPTVKTYASAVGKRQPSDQLIHFESRNVTNNSRFPSRAFEYTGDDSITCVKFAFNSPTAMALINTTFVSEKEFSAVAYDMNTDHFVANLSVYGYKYFTPSIYVNLLGQSSF